MVFLAIRDYSLISLLKGDRKMMFSTVEVENYLAHLPVDHSQRLVAYIHRYNCFSLLRTENLGLAA